MRDVNYVKLLLKMTLNTASETSGDIEKFFIGQAQKLQRELQKLAGNKKKVVVKSKKKVKTKQK